MRIFLSGGRGLLGSHILESLKSSDVDVFAPNRSNLDLVDKCATLEYLKVNRIDAVIHCAATVGGILDNIERPGDYILNNLSIDSSVLGSALELGISKLIYFGSSCMYPPEAVQPFKEIEILSGKLEKTNESYALSKIAGTKAVESISAQYSLDWQTLVLSNIYGPRDNFSEKSSHLLAAIIRKVHSAKSENLSHIEIWGDGSAKREFTYVEDVANFVVNKCLKASNLPKCMNLGSQEDFSVLDYYNKVCNMYEYFPEFRFNSSVPSGMHSKLMDSAIAREFDWEPIFSIDRGLMKTIEWFKSNAK